MRATVMLGASDVFLCDVIFHRAVASSYHITRSGTPLPVPFGRSTHNRIQLTTDRTLKQPTQRRGVASLLWSQCPSRPSVLAWPLPARGSAQRPGALLAWVRSGSTLRLSMAFPHSRACSQTAARGGRVSTGRRLSLLGQARRCCKALRSAGAAMHGSGGNHTHRTTRLIVILVLVLAAAAALQSADLAGRGPDMG